MNIAGLSALLVVAVFAMPAVAEDIKVDCGKAEMQIELNYCAEQDYQKADKALNDAWKKVRATAAAKDADLEKDRRGIEAALL